MRILKLTVYFLQIITSKITKKTIPDILFTAVSDFGGIYIKLIQFVCLRTNILPENDKLRFLSFYDDAPIEPLSIKHYIEKELGQIGLSRFSSIDATPFASGTFGQVYKARLTDGTDVVIKVKRPHLVSKLRFDFLLLRLFTKIFTLFVEQKIINLDSTLSEFEESTYLELDYIQEAKNAEYFYTIFRNHPRIYIPKTYLELCTNDILVQDYVGGVAVNDLIRFNTKHPGVYRDWLIKNYHTDPYTIFPNIAYDIAIQGINQGMFYADPHPGNIKLLPNNHYAYIDFGIVGSSPENKLLYYELLSSFSQKAADMDMEKIGKSFLQWGSADLLQQTHTFDDYFLENKNSLTNFLIDKYKSILENKREEFRSFDVEENFSQLCFSIVSSGTLLNVKVPHKFLLSLKTMIIFKSWATYLEPQYHFMRNTYQRILSDIDPKTLDSKMAKNVSTPETSLETILEWVETMGELDLPFQRMIDKQFMQNLYV